MKRIAIALVAFSMMLLSGLAVAASATSNLSWEPPTTRVDGSPLAPQDIQEFRVYYNIDGQPSLEGEPIVVGPGAVTETVTLDLTPRPTPYVVSFAITTVDTQGRESTLSDTVSKEFQVDSTASPGAPTSLQFTIECGDGCTITDVTAQ